MYKYEINKRFPHEQYLGRGEITISILNEAFFDVLVSLYNITPEERKIFRKGRLTVSLYEAEAIPFIIFDLGSFRFDININIHKISNYIDAWLNSNSNIINMFLVDAATGNLLAIRMIGISFAEDIRDICKRQSCLNDVDEKIQSILKIIPAKKMISKALKKQTF